VCCICDSVDEVRQQAIQEFGHYIAVNRAFVQTTAIISARGSNLLVRWWYLRLLRYWNWLYLNWPLSAGASAPAQEHPFEMGGKIRRFAEYARAVAVPKMLRQHAFRGIAILDPKA
jgi:hypothetical protein